MADANQPTALPLLLPANVLTGVATFVVVLFSVTLLCFNRRKRTAVPVSYEDAMADAYKQCLKPLEDRYHFSTYKSPPLDPLYFKEKPTILLIGQYSTGKTSLIHYLLQTPIPLSVEGPDPTTHSFSIIGDDTGKTDVIYGHELATDATKSYSQLAMFGSEFLQKVQLVSTSSQLLHHLTFVDTPGILSGRREAISRGYDFHSAISWFANRADLILLMYHPMKLDISDEFAAAIERLKPEWHKVKIVLNMVDKNKMSHEEQIRVHGYLRMKLGHLFVNQPESFPIYVANYSDQPTEGTPETCHVERQLMDEIQRLPQDSSSIRRNYLIQRAKLAKIYGYIESYLHDRYNSRWLYATDNVKSCIANLAEIYEHLQKTYDLSKGDFPDLLATQKVLLAMEPGHFAAFDRELFDKVDTMIRTLPKKDEPAKRATGGIFG